MGDITFNADGSVNLPVGFRFDPNNEILLNHYLRRRIFGLPVSEVMQQLNVFQTEPWNLPSDEERFTKRKYFFYDLRGAQFENMDKRVAGDGEWRTEEQVKIVALQSPHYIGKKTTLVYWKMQPTGDFEKTRWTMQEFRLSFVARPMLVSHLAAYRIYEMNAPKPTKKVKKVKGKFKSFMRKRFAKRTFIEANVENESVSVSVSASPPPPITP